MHLWIMKGLNFAFFAPWLWLCPIQQKKIGDGHALNALVSLTLDHALFVFDAGPNDHKYKHLFSFP